MTSTEPALVALVAATALHAGFQLTVTMVVYPALTRLGADRWSQGHSAHGRAITPVVGVVYLGLAAAAGWALLTHPRDPSVLVSAGAAASGVLLTALVAAPTHARLEAGPDPALLARLVRADRLRALAAVAALVAAASASA